MKAVHLKSCAVAFVGALLFVTSHAALVNVFSASNQLSIANSTTAADDAVITTVAFQQNLHLYSKAREYEISTQYNDSWNYYNGMSYGTLPTAYHTIGGSIYVSLKSGEEFRGLVRFDGISEQIPAGAHVVEAKLILEVTCWSGMPAEMFGRYLTTNWSYDQTKGLNNDAYKITGWRFSGPGASWSVPGALNDTYPNREFSTPLLQLGSNVREVALDPVIVQSWIENNEAKNFGVILFAKNVNDTFSVTSQTTVANEHKTFSPMLIVSYRPARNSTEASAVVQGPQLTPKAVNRSIFVDASLGNDTNTGDAMFPVRSLTIAVDLARPGDVIYLRNGVYGGCQISLPDITITSAPGHWGVIAGPLYDPNVGVVLYVRDTAHRFHIFKVEILGGYYYAIGTHTTWEYTNIGPTRELNGTAAENIIVEDCIIHDTGSSAIKLVMAVKNATIRRNVIHSTGRRMATYGHAVEGVNTKGGNILENYMYDLPGAGVKLSGGCKDVVVARNTIERAHLAGILLGFYEQTEYMDWITNHKWYECVRCRAVSNIIFNIHGTGIGLYASKDSVVAHNTLYSVAHTMMSLIVLSSVQHWENGTATGSPVTANANATIVNNLVTKGKLGRPGNMMMQIREVTSYVDSTHFGALEPNTPFTSQGNLYHTLSEATPVLFQWGRGVMLEDERKNSSFVGNLSAWQRQYPGWEVNSIDADPLLSLNFAPTVAACQDKGTPKVPIYFSTMPNSSDPLLDFDGKPIVADANGKVFFGARQKVEVNASVGAVNASVAPDFPPLRAFSEAHPRYTGRPVDYGHSRIWPFYEMESHVPRTYIISPNGTDDATNFNGTEAFPWKTAGFAMQKMWPGDTLLLRGGIYPNTLRISLPNITVSSYPGEWAKIVVSNSDTSVANAVYFADRGNGNFGGSGEVVLRNLEISGGYYYGIMFNQAGGGTSNQYWNWWKAQHGMVTPSKTIVEDCVIHDAGSHLIKISPEASDIVFRRLKMYRSGKRGETPAPPPANPQAAQGNEESAPVNTQPVETVQGNGFDIRGGHRITIEDCHISDVSGTAVLLGGGSADSVIQRNLIRNVAGIGILVGSFNTEAMYMRLVENPQLFQAQRAVVRNNIVVNASGAGLGLYSSQGTVAAHNTFADVAKTMHAALLFNIAPNFVNPSTDVLPTNEDCVVINNIFHQTVDAVGYMVENRVWTLTTSPVPDASFPGTDTCDTILSREFGVKSNASGSATNVTRTSGLNGGCPRFPPDNAWNTRIDNFGVHSLNDAVMKRLTNPGCRCLGGDLKNCFTAGSSPNCGQLHPDFGGYNTAENGAQVLSGFAITYVNSSVPKKTIPFSLYGDESDNIPYPFPSTAHLENTPDGCPIDVCSGDRHLIAVDTESCMLYETWKTEWNGTNWLAANGATFDLTSNALRPLGWTSADAAGLPIFPGLVRYDEIVRGRIDHAIRVTFMNTRKAYVLPATHYASPVNDENLPAMGHRFRLKKSFNCTSLARSARIVCVALQQYGAIVADNGANWYLSGEQHPNWNVAELDDVKKITADNMELVYTGDECIRSDCRPVAPDPVLPTYSAYRDLSTLYMNGNVYYKEAGDYKITPVEFVDRDPQHFWRSYLATDLSPWQAHLGGKMETSSIIGNPRFSSGYHLTNTSAAIFASPLAAQFAGDTDFFGRPRRVNAAMQVDAGAISYNESDDLFGFAAVLNRTLDFIPWSNITSLLPPDPSVLFVDPCANVSPGQTVFVALNGSDSSCTGAADAPFATLRIAVRRVADGGTVYLTPGTHSAGAVIGRNNVTITAATLSSRTVVRSTPLAGGDTLTIRGDYVTITNLEIVGGFTTTVAISGKYAVLQNNSIHGAGTAVVIVQPTASNAKIQSNLIRNSGQRIPRFGDGILVEGATNTVILDNTIRNIRSTAIHFRKGARSGLIARNTILNTRRGISVGNDNANNSPLPDFDDYSPIVDNNCEWFDAADNARCYAVRHVRVTGNAVYNSEGCGLCLAGSYNVSVLHNTFRKCANADQGPLYLTALQHYVNATYSPMVSNTRTTIKNNIFTARWESYRPMVYVRKSTSWGNDATVVRGVDAATAEVNGNLYFKETTPITPPLPFPTAFFKRNGGSIASQADTSFFDEIDGTLKTFAQWKAANSGIDVNSLVTDPLFSSAVPFSLGALSPALLAGVTLASEPSTLDLLGLDITQLNRLPDIGAVQSDSSAAAAVKLTSTTNFPSNIFNLSIASPSSCIPAESTPKACDGVDCWHPWLSTSAPTSLNMSRLLTTCLNNGQMFPQGHGMSRDLRNDRTHPLSDAYKTSIATNKIHPDFGTIYSGIPMGIPYSVVLGSKYNTSRVKLRYLSESDDVGYVIPANVPVEGGDCDINGDRHILVLDAETCKVYELFKSVFIDPEYQSWLGVGLSADSGVVFDMKSTAYRPLGFTSADAAGLSVFAGLVFKEEIDRGVINHAIRYTVMKSQMAYVYPTATHFASSDPRADLPPMGQRARLKPWFNCTQYPTSKVFSVVCQAMKEYGLILADNGGNWFVSGSSDARWDDVAINALYNIPTSAIDIVDTGDKLCTTTSCV